MRLPLPQSHRVFPFQVSLLNILSYTEMRDHGERKTGQAIAPFSPLGNTAHSVSPPAPLHWPLLASNDRDSEGQSITVLACGSPSENLPLLETGRSFFRVWEGDFEGLANPSRRSTQPGRALPCLFLTVNRIESPLWLCLWVQFREDYLRGKLTVEYGPCFPQG